MVMDYEAGEPLSQLLERRGTLPEDELRRILNPLLNGLERVHAASLWHRDIKPANVLVRADGSPVLIDFGAVRQERKDRPRSVMAVYSPAYAAPEQVYAMGEQGPWTDIYGLGATLYRAVVGSAPKGAAERSLGAQHVPAIEVAAGRYTVALLRAIDAALALKIEDRPRSISAWRKLLGAGPSAEAEARTVVRPAGQRVVLDTGKPGRTYREGEYLVVQATASRAFDGYLYVDYLDSAGSLVHTLPSPVKPNNRVRAGQRLTLGVEGDREVPNERRYEIVPPHGRSLIIALATRQPLFDQERPEVESAADYLQALQSSLDRVAAQGRAADVAPGYLFFSTHP